MAKHQQLYDFMDNCLLMVISTVNSSGSPQSAVVGFGQNDNLELIFGTSSKSRKAKNILNDPRVSVVIGWDKTGTIQYEGTAKLLTGDDIDYYSEIYFSKNPGSRKHKDSPDECYFLVTPTWIKFTQTTGKPWIVQEYEF